VTLILSSECRRIYYTLLSVEFQLCKLIGHEDCVANTLPRENISMNGL
jgi:hypothetical protein